jgi:hypothetical protein
MRSACLTKVRRKLRAAIVLLAAAAVHAQDARIAELQKWLLPMRANPDKPLPVRGATSQFTAIKHTLRDWIESRMATMDSNTVQGLQDKVNQEVVAAKLVCDFRDLPCPEWTERGYLEPIKVRVEFGYTIVQTGVGVDNCGFDESAYAYELADKGWRRFWESEQTNYTEDGFQPQTFSGIEIYSQPYGPAGYLILSMGYNPWCTSNWQPFYVRVWQGKAATEPKLLLDVKDDGMLWDEPAIRGRVGAADHLSRPGDDVLVEYTKSFSKASDSGREVVRHYRLTDGRLQRIDPIALGPLDFVAAWDELDGPARANWTDRAVRATLVSLKLEDAPRDPHPTRRCESKPETWQVHFGGRYFLVRWRPPFHFMMMDSDTKPFAGCTEVDPEADDFRSLFR